MMTRNATGLQDFVVGVYLTTASQGVVDYRTHLLDLEGLRQIVIGAFFIAATAVSVLAYAEMMITTVWGQ